MHGFRPSFISIKLTQLLPLERFYRGASILFDDGLMILWPIMGSSQTLSRTIMSNEEMCERARVYIRENAAPQGRPNLTAAAFCQWVNNDLLPNSTLDPGFPRRVSVETARKWLHNMGFDVLHTSKGVFIDGHKRPDVVESREKFLRKMTECGFFRPDNAPTEEALPADVPHLSKKREKNTLCGSTTRVPTPQLKTRQCCGSKRENCP